MSNHKDKTAPIRTDAGTSDGIVGNGEPLTGHGTREDQEGASAFWEEIGALVEGKEEDDIHTPDMENEAT